MRPLREDGRAGRRGGCAAAGTGGSGARGADHAAGLPDALPAAGHGDGGRAVRRSAGRRRTSHRGHLARGPSAAARCAAAFRSAGQSLCGRGRSGLDRQRAPVRCLVIRGRTGCAGRGRRFPARRPARSRLADGAGAGLPADGRAGTAAHGPHHPQHRVPGALQPEPDAVPTARHRLVPFRRTGVPRRSELPEGRPRLLRPDHHRQPDLCAGDPDTSNSAWDWKACCRRAATRCAGC